MTGKPRADALDAPLIMISPQDPWSVRDAFEGTAIFGGNGSGKTSGSGWTIAEAFLRNGFGGLVLTVKPDETSRWLEYAKATGRAEDVRVVRPGGDQRLNFLEYEFSRQGPGAHLTHSLVWLLQTAMEGGRERRSREPYWDDAVAQLLTNAIDLVTMATGDLQLSDIVAAIRSAPMALAESETMLLPQEKRDELSRQGRTVWADRARCAKMLAQAEQRGLDEDRLIDLRETVDFWLWEFAPLDPRTRSNVMSTLMTRLTGLLRSPYRQIFSSDTTVRPEDTYDRKIILLDLPVKEYGEVGRFAQVLFKTVWQRAVERRGGTGNPVFLWADEAQFFVTKYDMMFQQTARSSRAATVYLSQSVANYRAAIGDGENSKDVIDSLLGTLQTKIFHANGCPVTNEYAEALFASELRWTQSATVTGDGDTQIGAQKGYLPVLPRISFTTLKKGGTLNSLCVEGYVFQAGRRWAGNRDKNWLLATFHQNGP